MHFQIVNTTDHDRIFCAGSFSKLTTTFVVLSLLAEKKYPIDEVVDDANFLTTLAKDKPEATEFLTLFQHKIGGNFTIRDICSYYTGLPYTFDLTEAELESVEAGNPFKHHSIPDEKTFLFNCQHKISTVYPFRSKFLYSEISILFLGYFMEKVFKVKMDELYQRLLINKFQLKSSSFSRTRVPGVYCTDLSDKYDYPSIAILDHGYFCYSNGFYTTLSDMQILLDQLLEQPVFHCMTNINKARAASPRLLNGMAVEIRLKGNDIIYGYEGLSFSGCNIWAYSTLHQQGYVAFTEDEEAAYPLIYDHWNYTKFDTVPAASEVFYQQFIKNFNPSALTKRDIPEEYIGHYQRVRINEKILATIFEVGKNFITIRNPDMITYDVVYKNFHYCIQTKDGVGGANVEFYTSMAGNQYMLFDGTLYKKISTE